MKMYSYSIFNFIVHSELLLPNLNVMSQDKVQADCLVTIEFGHVSTNGLPHPSHDGVCYQATTKECWLNIPTVARFLITNGQKIIIDPHPETNNESILAFLYGACFEILLRQQRLLILSGDTLNIEGHGVAFLGPASLGQSMLLGIFYQQDYAMISGNYFALNNQGHILPAIAQIELWPNVAAYLGIETKALKTLRPGVEKYIIPLAHQFHSTPLSLDYIYILQASKHPTITFSKVESSQKIHYLQKNCHGFALSNLSDDVFDADHYIRPASAAEMICIHLPGKGLDLAHLAETIKCDVTQRNNEHVQS